ncbi:DUF2059 domain-containing protein [Pseudoxanthomonas winnipegensis]|uniref:DUF2059 domain-containing protein n=1 Tax=Pseudoxanthomonas winnipegensis TaxID=2480810 RepID=A0A4V2HDC6_9GAMM|nr:DUF2059 domain-containing protein [Pseudoxanthomonas winnipegensis]TAA26832.1 DUF2059 domain-containing protein [Pseudoxanthomonas winnipegensis]
MVYLLGWWRDRLHGGASADALPRMTALSKPVLNHVRIRGFCHSHAFATHEEPRHFCRVLLHDNSDDIGKWLMGKRLPPLCPRPAIAQNRAAMPASGGHANQDRTSCMLRSILAAALLYAVAVAALAAPAAPAPEAPASEASVRELLQVTDVRAMMRSMEDQVRATVGQSMQHAVQGQALNDAQRAILDRTGKQMVDVMLEQMRYDVMEPEYIRLYTESFSQADVDGMLAFYRSPAGQSMLKKMPGLMKNSMVLIQQRMQLLMPQIQKLQSEMVEQLRAAKSEDASGKK